MVSTDLVDSYVIYVASKTGECLDSIFVNNGGNCTFQKPANECFLSVYKHNYVPCVFYCNFEKNALQNMNVYFNSYYDNTPFAMGEYVDEEEDSGDITLKNGSTTIIQKGAGGVLMDYGFECEKGATLIIK